MPVEGASGWAKDSYVILQFVVKALDGLAELCPDRRVVDFVERILDAVLLAVVIGNRDVVVAAHAKKRPESKHGKRCFAATFETSAVRAFQTTTWRRRVFL